MDYNFKISIIIPVFNVEDYIKRAFNSLLNQTIGFENLEVIFIDDKSTDSSPEIIKKYSNEYDNVNSIFLNKNSGSGGKPRNIGMAHATTDYLMFLDSEDVLMEDACKTLYDEIIAEDVDIVSGVHTWDGINPSVGLWESILTNPHEDFQTRQNKTNDLLKNFPLKINSIDDCESVIGDFAFQPKIYKKSFLENNSIIFPEEILAEDSVFLLNTLLNANGIKYINKMVYHHVQERTDGHNLSVHHIHSKKNLKSLLVAFYEMYYISLEKNKSKIFKEYLLYQKLEYFLKSRLLNSNLSVGDVLDLLIYSTPLFRLCGDVNSSLSDLYRFISNGDYENALRVIFGKDTLNQKDIKIISNINSFKNDCKLIELQSDSWLDQFENEKPDLFIFKQNVNEKITDYCNKNNIPIISINNDDFDFKQILDSIKFNYIPYLKHIVVFYELEDLRQINDIHNHFYSIDYPFKHLKLITEEKNLFLDDAILKSELNKINLDDNYYFCFCDLNLDPDLIRNNLLDNSHKPRENLQKIKNTIFSNADYNKIVKKYLKECDNPKISVIFPVYNVEDYIREALDSLVNQTFIDHIEVLMINGGSTDNSGNIIEEYSQRYENFHAYHKDYAGPSSSRNYGLNFACGDYIHFMDSDDFIAYDSYEKLYNFAVTDNYDVVTSNYLRFDSKKLYEIAISVEVFKNYAKNIHNTNLYEYINLAWDTPVWNKIIKREFLQENNIRFSRENILYEDNLFMIEVYSKAKNVGVLNDVTYYWRIRDSGNSITQNIDINHGKKLYTMVSYVNEFITKNITDKTIIAKKYSKLLKVDLIVFINRVKNFQNQQDREYLLESAYDIVNLIPNHYINNLSPYYKLICKMIKNKDWNELLVICTYGFRSNPIIPENINKEYLNNIDFKIDSHFEELNSKVSDVFCEDNELVIDFRNNILFYLSNNFDKTQFKLLNSDFDSVLLDSNYIIGSKLHIPFDLINFGENLLFTSVYFDDIKKENYMKTSLCKTFSFNDFEISTRKDKFNNLKILKLEKNDVELIIDEVIFNENNLHFIGYSNKKLNNIIIKDTFDILTIKCPLSYLQEGNYYKIHVVLNFNDLFKSPMKQWELTSEDIFKKINLRNEYEFVRGNYIIIIKNYENTIGIKLKFNYDVN